MPNRKRLIAKQIGFADKSASVRFRTVGCPVLDEG